MSNKDYELDAILAEFGDVPPSKRAKAQTPPPPEPVIESEPVYEDEPVYGDETVYEDEIVYEDEPAYEDDGAYEDDYEDGADYEDELAYEDDAADEDEEPAPRKKGGVARRIGRALLNVVLGALLCLCLVWAAVNIHPSALSIGAKPIRRSESTPAPVTTEEPAPAESAPDAESDGPDAQAPAPETEPEPTPEPTPEPVHYSIPEDALAAPAPDPARYGTVPVTEADKLLDVIRQARDSGLLGEDEITAFDPAADFYNGMYDKGIQYYLDDSILVICWKEWMDGYCCSLSEVKVADGSQFRRKLADDTFGAGNQYNATTLAASVNAVVAMNADYYLFRDFGIVVYGRELYRFNTANYTGQYSKYNCVDTLFVDDEGDFLFKELLEENTEDSILQFVEDNNIRFSIAFGPILIRDGQVQEITWYPIGEVNKGYSRAGIGQVDKLHYLWMSADHAEQQSRWTVQEFAEHFARKPVQVAYGLDGGQTGECVFQGEPYNHVDYGQERTVSDIIYFASAIPSEGA